MTQLVYTPEYDASGLVCRLYIGVRPKPPEPDGFYVACCCCEKQVLECATFATIMGALCRECDKVLTARSFGSGMYAADEGRHKAWQNRHSLESLGIKVTVRSNER